MGAPFKTFTVSLATSGAASSAISLEGYTPLAIEMSTGWTGTKIHFQGSRDGTTFKVITTSTGGELQFTVAANKYIVINDPERFLGLEAIKIRPGVSTLASTQAAARTIYLVARAL